MRFKRLDQLQRVWQIDHRIRQSGIRRGFFIKSFYQSRLIARFPAVFSPHKVRINFSDSMAKKNTASAMMRVDGGGGDLAIIAGLLGDREYWDDSLFPVGRLLDLGANIGLAALWFSIINPGLQVACVEPDPRNLPLLRMNLEMNNLKAAVFACAVDSGYGELKLAYGDHTGCSSLTSTGLHNFTKTITVETKRISNILDELGWDNVDVIKMDVEGAGRDILKSCSSWIDRVRRIVLEIHSTTSPEEISAIMRPFGFSLRCIGHGIEPTYILEREL